jgi:hypothetical protein
MLRMKTPRRYLGECEGERKWAAAARTSMIRVKRAAMGCTIRIAERVVLVSVGISKLLVWESLKSLAKSSNQRWSHSGRIGEKINFKE